MPAEAGTAAGDGGGGGEGWAEAPGGHRAASGGRRRAGELPRVPVTLAGEAGALPGPKREVRQRAAEEAAGRLDRELGSQGGARSGRVPAVRGLSPSSARPLRPRRDRHAGSRPRRSQMPAGGGPQHSRAGRARRGLPWRQEDGRAWLFPGEDAASAPPPRRPADVDARAARYVTPPSP